MYTVLAQEITELKTDKAEYKPGELVTITGKTSGIPDGTQVTIEVRDPIGSVVFVEQTGVTNNQFDTSFRLDTEARVGKYTVYAKISAYSITKTATFYVKQPTTISISLSATSIGLGESVTISGAISPAVEGAIVKIMYEKEGGSWRQLAQVTTDDQGRYSYTWRPTEVGTYHLKSTWEGDDTHFGATSNVVTLTVGKRTSSITLTVSPETVRIGEEVQIMGKLTPSMTTQIKLTITAPDGSTQEIMVTTSADGSFSYTFVPNKLGRWYVKAEWAGTAEWGPASAETSFVVKAPTTLTISISQTTVTVGSTVVISGKISPALEGISIMIKYRYPGGSWVTLTTVRTDSEGKFSYTYLATVAGVIEFKAVWPGNEQYFGSESNIVKLTVVSFVKTTLHVYVTPPQITLGEEVTISGYIEPAIEGIEITISYKLGAESWRTLTKVKTDSEGKFSFKWKPEETGTYVIMAVWAGTDIYTGAIAVDTLVVFTPKYSLTVTAVDSHNTPLVGATVIIAGQVTLERTTDSSGTVAVGDLPAGKYTIEVIWHGVIVYSKSVTLSESTNIKALCDVYYVTIKVVRNGKPVPNVKVKLALPDGTILEGTTGSDGTTVLKQVPKGTYIVLADSVGKIVAVSADTVETITLPPKPIPKVTLIGESAAIIILLAIIVILLRKLRGT